MKSKSQLNFFSNVREEIKKITWPSRNQVLRITFLVVVSTIVAGALLGILDYFLSYILEKILI